MLRQPLLHPLSEVFPIVTILKSKNKKFFPYSLLFVETHNNMKFIQLFFDILYSFDS